MLEEINNPHDMLFKKVEGVKENCRDLIESTFPAEVLENLDLDTLEKDENSYVGRKLQGIYTDLVYDCIYSGKIRVKISLLFEHKSHKPKYEYIQLLRYILAVWEHAIAAKEKPPVVIPILFYHGVDEWEPLTIFNIFEGVDSVLKSFIPDFSYIFTTLKEISDNEIWNVKFQNNVNKVLALLFKHMKDEEYLKDQLEDILSLLKEEIEENSGDDENSVIFSFIMYIIYTTEIDSEYFADCLDRVSHGGGDLVMTTAMKLIQKGREEGQKIARTTAEKLIEQGRVEGQRIRKTTAEKLIEQGRMEGQRIRKTTAEKLIQKGRETGELTDKRNVLIRQADKKFGISEKDKKTITSITDQAKLDAALDEIITAETLEEILSQLK